MWGISSVGRALDLHSRGQEFESPILHQILRNCRIRFVSNLKILMESLLVIKIEEVPCHYLSPK